MPGFPVLSPTPRACSNLSIESVMPSNHLILCCPLLLLPSVFPRIWVFFKKSVLPIRWSKHWSSNFSISASVLSMNIQDWFPLGQTGLISLQSKELSRVFSSTTVRKHQFFGAQPSLWSSSHAGNHWSTLNLFFSFFFFLLISKMRSRDTAFLKFPWVASGGIELELRFCGVPPYFWCLLSKMSPL